MPLLNGARGSAEQTNDEEKDSAEKTKKPQAATMLSIRCSLGMFSHVMLHKNNLHSLTHVGPDIEEDMITSISERWRGYCRGQFFGGRTINDARRQEIRYNMKEPQNSKKAKKCDNEGRPPLLVCRR